MNTNNIEPKKRKKWLIVPMLLLAYILYSQSVVVTEPGEYRVIKQFGKIVRVEENDGSSYGISFKIPFIQSETAITGQIG